MTESLGERIADRTWRRPGRWRDREWTDDRVIRLSLTVSTLVVTTVAMMWVNHFNPLDWLFGFGFEDVVFDDTTPTGGDMGAHVWAPAYLRDSLLPNFQLAGWSMDWYGGLPVYRFYMVVPALAMLLFDIVLPYGAAFKIVVALALVSMPAACWAFGRLAKFRYPIPELFAFGGLCFVLNESYTLYGGNVLSTMAGEFSFAMAMSLMMVGLGLLARALREGHNVVAAGCVLALACLSHGIVLIYTMVGAIVLVVCYLGADAWRLFTVAVNRRGVEQRLVYAVLMSPAVIALTVLIAQFSSAAYVLTVVAVVAAIGAVVALSVIVGRNVWQNRVLRQRFLIAMVVGGLTLALSAFWVGPFLFNHEFMTDMKYGFRPQGPEDSFWDMLFDQKKVFFDLLINTLAIIGFGMAIARKHVAGIALGITALVAVALVYLTRDSLPVIGLLWNARLLPWLFAVRYLLMMVGAFEVGALVTNVVRNHPARQTITTGVATAWGAAIAAVVLIIFGWIFQILPGGRVEAGDPYGRYAWGPVIAPNGQSNDALSDRWPEYNYRGYEGNRMYPEYHDLVQTMAAIGETEGCGRTLWERTDPGYGTPMALMLLPHWTDGCITSSEGLYFEASGTTPYHFITADAMSSEAYSPVRQIRETINDADVGVPYLRTLGIRFLMVKTDLAVAEADAHPGLELLATSGPWHIYRVLYAELGEAINGSDETSPEPITDSELVVPLDVQPVVVNPREGDPRECYLELGTSWFQQPWEWDAIPATSGPETWQHIDVAIDPARQDPQGQPLDGCGDPESLPNRRVNIVVPAEQIDVVELPEITVSNVELGDQSVAFDVSEPGVPVLVRVSYFPNWTASGADGPYRIAPNLMVVVPTETHVELRYRSTTTDKGFYALTGFGLLGAVALAVRPLRTIESVRDERRDGESDD